MAIGYAYLPILVYFRQTNLYTETWVGIPTQNLALKNTKNLNMTPCHGSAQPAELSYQSGPNILI